AGHHGRRGFWVGPRDEERVLLQCAGHAHFGVVFDCGAVPARKEQARRGAVAARSGGPVKNLNSIFAAYMIGWGVFFLFFSIVVKGCSGLISEIESLKKKFAKDK